MIEKLSPTRVDLAGGTLDLWPLYNFLPRDPVTINLGIDVMTRAKLQERNDNEIHLTSKDLNLTKVYSNINALREDTESPLNLLREIALHFSPKMGFDLSTQSNSPIGGGLGGSSSLCISALKAFCEWQNKEFSVHEMVNLAHNIESKILKTPTGTQDYIPPLMGGLLAIRYGADGMKIERLSLDPQVFDEHFLLVYTGKPHHSGLNNWQVMKDVVDGNQAALKNLEALAEVSEQLYQEIRKGNWGALSDIFEEEFKHRVSLSSVFAGEQIMKLRDLALESGASSVKICGAGGGGCVIVWAKPGEKNSLAERLKANSYEVLPTGAFFYEDRN